MAFSNNPILSAFYVNIINIKVRFNIKSVVADSKIEMVPPVPKGAPDFVKNVTARMIAREGDDLPVSALPIESL